MSRNESIFSIVGDDFPTVHGLTKRELIATVFAAVMMFKKEPYVNYRHMAKLAVEVADEFLDKLEE